MPNSRKRKQRVNQHLHGRMYNKKFLWQSAEDRSWEAMAPVGREFGSPDYDQLLQQDWMATKANLDAVVATCEAQMPEEDLPVDPDEHEAAINVQAALRELRVEVSVAVAAAVWRKFSPALEAGWMSGAESPIEAKRSILVYCLPKT